MKKKLIPILLFIMAFTGFLSTQILWDNFNLKAVLVDQDKQKHSVYETNFQALNLTTTNGTKIDLKAEKTPIIVLNFWASWCVPCLKEFPSLVKLQAKYSGKVKIIGINGDTDNPLDEIRKIEGRYKLNFESVVDVKEAYSEKFKIQTYPVSIVYHNGKVIYVSKKIHNFMDTEFIKMIDKALMAN